MQKKTYWTAEPFVSACCRFFKNYTLHALVVCMQCAQIFDLFTKNWQDCTVDGIGAQKPDTKARFASWTTLCAWKNTVFFCVDS